MSCCPPGSHAALKTEYECIGKVVNKDGLDIYEVFFFLGVFFLKKKYSQFFIS